MVGVPMRVGVAHLVSAFVVVSLVWMGFFTMAAPMTMAMTVFGFVFSPLVMDATIGPDYAARESRNQHDTDS